MQSCWPRSCAGGCRVPAHGADRWVHHARGVPTGVACILVRIPVHSLGGEARGMRQSRTSIVCGVDSSTGSRDAVGVAAELAARLDLRLVLTHAVDDSPPFPYGDARELELQRAR